MPGLGKVSAQAPEKKPGRSVIKRGLGDNHEGEREAWGGGGNEGPGKEETLAGERSERQGAK